MLKYADLLRNIGYKFVDESWLELALTHRSMGSNNNERLEFLGDAILNLVVADELYHLFDNASEGQLTRMRANFICEDMLSTIAKQWNLGKYIILGAGEQRSGGHQRASILADALEAIIGAMYFDANKDFSIVKLIVASWFAEGFTTYNDKKLRNHKDAKTQLQELLQAKKLNLPEYEVIKIEGEKHEQTFHVTCKNELIDEITTGIGSNRRKAEQAAAAKVLEVLNARKS